MPRTWKDILIPGTYRLPDGDEITFTLSDCQAAAETGKRMLAQGLRIPQCWEHDPKQVPTYGQATGYGEAVDYRVQGGQLEALLDVPDHKDAERLKHVRTVSPRVEWDFVDERGKLWPGISVAHVAATLVPVQTNQQPVQLSAVRNRPGKTVYLSQMTRVGATTVDIKKVLAALAKLGITLPEETTAENLEHSLNVLASAGMKAEPGDDDPMDDDADLFDDEPNPDANNTATASSSGSGVSGVMMSRLSSFAKLTNSELLKRIDQLQETARVDVATADKLRKGLKSVNLSAVSFNGSGKLKGKAAQIESRIRAYESLPPGRGGQDLSNNTSVVKRPSPTNQSAGDETSAIEFMTRGLPAKKKQG